MGALARRGEEAGKDVRAVCIVLCVQASTQKCAFYAAAKLCWGTRWYERGGRLATETTATGWNEVVHRPKLRVRHAGVHVKQAIFRLPRSTGRSYTKRSVFLHGIGPVKGLWCRAGLRRFLPRGHHIEDIADENLPAKKAK